MKKTLIALLICAMTLTSVFALTGCGGGSSEESTDAGETITFMAPDWAIPSDEQLDVYAGQFELFFA